MSLNVMFQTDHQGQQVSLAGFKPRISIPALEPYKIRLWQRAVVDAVHILDLDHTLDNQSRHLPASGTPAAKDDAQDLDGAARDFDQDDIKNAAAAPSSSDQGPAGRHQDHATNEESGQDPQARPQGRDSSSSVADAVSQGHEVPGQASIKLEDSRTRYHIEFALPSPNPVAPGLPCIGAAEDALRALQKKKITFYKHGKAETTAQRRDRLFLFQSLVQSVSKYPYITDSIAAGDVRAIWDRASTIGQPSIDTTLKRSTQQLHSHRKTRDLCFHDWHHKYTSILADLQISGIPMDGRLRRIYLLDLVGNDERYKETIRYIERQCIAQEHEVVMVLAQRAQEIGDDVANNRHSRHTHHNDSRYRDSRDYEQHRRRDNGHRSDNTQEREHTNQRQVAYFMNSKPERDSAGYGSPRRSEESTSRFKATRSGRDERSSTNKPGACFTFARTGVCNRASCTYTHDKHAKPTSGAPRGDAARPRRPAMGEDRSRSRSGGKGGGANEPRGRCTPPITCFQWQTNSSCTYGADCKFDHPSRQHHANMVTHTTREPSIPSQRSHTTTRKREHEREDDNDYDDDIDMSATKAQPPKRHRNKLDKIIDNYNNHLHDFTQEPSQLHAANVLSSLDGETVPLPHFASQFKLRQASHTLRRKSFKLWGYSDADCDWASSALRRPDPQAPLHLQGEHEAALSLAPQEVPQLSIEKIAEPSRHSAAYPLQAHQQAAVAILFPDHARTHGKQRANAARLAKKVNDTLSAIVDSGASAHFAPDTPQLRRFILPETLRPDSATIVQADGHSVLKAHSSGTIVIKSDNPDHAINGQILLNVVYLVPGLQRMLISVTQLTRDGYSVSFAKSTLSIASHDARPLLHLQYAKPTAIDALYDIPQALFQPGQLVHQANLATNFKEADQLKALHHRLGHTNYGRCKQLFTLLTGKRSSREEWCCSCAMTKVHRIPFPKQARHIATRPLERVSTDVCGPFATRSINHERYFCVFIDHFTNYVHVALMKHKRDFEDVFEAFFHAAQAIHQPLTLTHLHSDNAMDTTQMRKFCAANGVTQVLTPPYSSASNGRAERCIRTITEAAQAMRYHSGLPPSYWAFAALAAAHTLNHIPRTFTAGARAPAPIELWERFEAKSIQDLLQRLRPFECECVCLRNKRKKIEIKGERCVFLGYASHSKAYYLLSLDTQRIITARNVITNETNFPYARRKQAQLMDKISQFGADGDFDDDAKQDDSDASAASGTEHTDTLHDYDDHDHPDVMLPSDHDSESDPHDADDINTDADDDDEANAHALQHCAI